MGSLFAEKFKEKGYEVIISGRDTEISYEEAARKGDVVIVTVPIRVTEEIIKKIGKHVREDAMLTDLTSVKTNPCEVMEKSCKGEIIGGHPVFGPIEDIEGKNYILCPIKKGNYFEWYKEFLESLGLNVFVMSPDEHDKNMAVIQCLNHFSNLSFGNVMKREKLDLDLLNKLSSPAFFLRFNTVGRMLEQNPELYTDIELENPYSKEMAEKYIEAAEELKKSISEKDREKFEEIFSSAKSYFGEYAEKAKKITDKMLEKVKNDG